MIKRAMILAAGFGKRIQPLTLTCPKPLLKIGDKTLLFNTLIFLENLFKPLAFQPFIISNSLMFIILPKWLLAWVKLLNI